MLTADLHKTSGLFQTIAGCNACGTQISPFCEQESGDSRFRADLYVDATACRRGRNCATSTTAQAACIVLHSTATVYLSWNETNTGNLLTTTWWPPRICDACSNFSTLHTPMRNYPCCFSSSTNLGKQIHSDTWKIHSWEDYCTRSQPVSFMITSSTGRLRLFWDVDSSSTHTFHRLLGSSELVA